MLSMKQPTYVILYSKVKLKRPNKKRSKTAGLHFLKRGYYHELRYSVIQTGAGFQACSPRET